MSKNKDDILTELAEASDKELLNWIKIGKPVFTLEGVPVKDENGQPVMRPLTAAEMNVIRQRLKDCGITTPASKNSTPSQMAAAMPTGAGIPGNFRFKLPGNLPPVSREPDAATA